MKEYVKLTSSENFWHFSPVWIYGILSFIVFKNTIFKSIANFQIEDVEFIDFVYLILYVLSIVFLYLLRRNGLRYQVYKMECSFDDFQLAIKESVIEDNWSIVEQNNMQVKVVKRGLFSRLGELITVEKKGELVLINSICFPGPTTNPFDPVSNKKNIKKFISKLKAITD